MINATMFITACPPQFATIGTKEKKMSGVVKCHTFRELCTDDVVPVPWKVKHF